MLEPEPSGDVLLYEKRKSVFPKAVKGPFRRFKWVVMIVTLAIYYITPWIRWDRGPFAPNQAVLVDLANRRFYMFDIEIWPHEFYFVAGLLIMAGIGLFLVTSAVGRMRLKSTPWGPAKIARRAIKWYVYLSIAFITGGAWIYYFADAPTLHHQFWTGTASPIAYATVAVLTATTLIFGGFMREQVCIYMCPWPRIQTAMLDEKSLIVTYKDWRGEPRGSVKEAAKSLKPLGDCVDCNQCVAVCPTGIDIREGPQIGCITCALCIDACDGVMKQLGRPRGLIDYATLDGSASEKAGAPPENILKTIFRPRTLIYFGVWGGIGLGLLFLLGTRKHIDVSVAKDRNPTFMLMSDGAVRNAYTVKLRNMEGRPREMEIGLLGLDGAKMWSDDAPRSSAARTLRRKVAADQANPVRVYVIAPANTHPQDFAFTLRALDKQGGSDSHQAKFDAPGDEE
jgi:cytochrome c oxidase accessory protein FixG